MEDSQQQRSRQFWDQIAQRSDNAAFSGLLSPDSLLSVYRNAAEKQILLARHGDRLRATARVLEIGCGGGRWTTWLAQRSAQVVATDISPEMIKRASQCVAAAALANVEFHVSSLEDLPALGQFDMVYLSGCLQYVSDEALEQALPRVARMVSPSGTLLTRDSVSLIGRTFRRGELYPEDDPVIYRPVAWYRERFEQSGLRLLDEWPTYVIPLSWRLRRVLPAAVCARSMQIEMKYAAMEVRNARLLRKAGPKEHRFYVYDRP